jgi:hypothetical protein
MSIDGARVAMATDCTAPRRHFPPPTPSPLAAPSSFPRRRPPSSPCTRSRLYDDCRRRAAAAIAIATASPSVFRWSCSSAPHGLEQPKFLADKRAELLISNLLRSPRMMSRRLPRRLVFAGPDRGTRPHEHHQSLLNEPPGRSNATAKSG